MSPEHTQSAAALLSRLDDLGPSEISDRLKDLVVRWLNAEGLTFEEVEPEEGVAWVLVVHVGEDWSVHVVQPTASPDQLVVSAGTNLNEYHQGRFREEPLDTRRRLSQLLRDSLHSELVEKSFQIETEGEEHPLAGVLQAFLLRKSIYLDGLSKNRFFETLTRVQTVRMRGVRFIQAQYGTSESPLDPVI